MVGKASEGGVFLGMRTAREKDCVFLSMSMFVMFVRMKRAAVKVMAKVKKPKSEASTMAAMTQPSTEDARAVCCWRQYAPTATPTEHRHVV